MATASATRPPNAASHVRRPFTRFSSAERTAAITLGTAEPSQHEEGRMAVEVGQEAPDFTLRNEDGEEVTLSSHRGHNVVLVFYPLAFSGICTKELHDVTDLTDQFGDANAEVFG